MCDYNWFSHASHCCSDNHFPCLLHAIIHISLQVPIHIALPPRSSHCLISCPRIGDCFHFNSHLKIPCLYLTLEPHMRIWKRLPKEESIQIAVMGQFQHCIAILLYVHTTLSIIWKLSNCETNFKPFKHHSSVCNIINVVHSQSGQRNLVTSHNISSHDFR